MSSKMMEQIKNKVKKSTAHDLMIDPVISDVNGNVNVDVDKPNVDHRLNEEIDEAPTARIRTRQKRKKFEELHTRQTYYIENDLLKELNKWAGNEKGEKTRIINEALRAWFEKESNFEE